MVDVFRPRKLSDIMNNREHGLAPVRVVWRGQATAISAPSRIISGAKGAFE